MARLSQPYSMDASLNPSFSLPPGHSGRGAGKNPAIESVEQLIQDISNPALRENALLQLSKEIVSIYRYLSPPVLETASAVRVCNVLALFQCVASHSETRIPFLQAHIPLYLYPFLNITNKDKPYEFLRLTSLGVIGALVKADDTDVICYLLHTEIVPLCLRSMENGGEISQTVAIFIVQKIVLDDVGLYYVCSVADRFSCVTRMLGTVVDSLAGQPSLRLLKHIIRCFLRFSENHGYYYARSALPRLIPKKLMDGTFENVLRNDEVGRLWLQQLLFNVYGERSVSGQHGAFVQ
ncbi:cell differentiation protein RCD1 homolog isoform X2 [Phalaenopsis equestris]|uniref:cell differentiation protein RCD1 homolog isoform X2 n=1 Tax=Phalaenopsis equestris TaxID=78828 RepID=UPI0009E444B4|nr:cell differentiation protein RCD1 homolog isoform X2 [Phalaenopsis equestris]